MAIAGPQGYPARTVVASHDVRRRLKSTRGPWHAVCKAASGHSHVGNGSPAPRRGTSAPDTAPWIVNHSEEKK
jgi:hypothetical protein